LIFGAKSGILRKSSSTRNSWRAKLKAVINKKVFAGDDRRQQKLLRAAGG